MQCQGIRGDGLRCKHEATQGSFCWSHNPQTAGERKARARRGGLRGGNGRPAKQPEIEALKDQARQLYDEVCRGAIPSGVGSVLVQILNLRVRTWEVQRRADIEDAGVITEAQLHQWVKDVFDILTRHVTDQKALQAIGDDLQKIDGS